MSYLYRYETKGIQNWILSSSKLRDLAGGSALIEALTKAADEAATQLGATVLQATSGAMTAVFPGRDQLEQFASEWPMHVAYRTPGLHLVQAWVEESEGIKALFDSLTHRRSKMKLTAVETNPWVLRTGQSGLPAVPNPGIRSKARATALDRAALAKERARGDLLSRASGVTGGRAWSDFVEPDDWPEGMMAVIHADGTGVGQRLLDLATPKQLKAFSEALKQASEAAIKQAVGQLGTGNRLLARPIVSAGDDLTYLVEASQARRFTEEWLRAFEAETLARKDALGGKLYGGAGIVYLGKGYPFSGAYAMAEALCTQAKNALKLRKRQASVLAFRRVTNSLVEDIAAQATAWVVGPDRLPLERLVEIVRQLPRGTLRTWLDHFQRPHGHTQASRLWARAAEVATVGLWSRFSEALEAVGANPGTGEFLAPNDNSIAIPLGKSARATPVLDALTLRALEQTEVVNV